MCNVEAHACPSALRDGGGALKPPCPARRGTANAAPVAPLQLAPNTTLVSIEYAEPCVPLSAAPRRRALPCLACLGAMGKGIKRPAKAKGSQDFAKKKHKVGRKLAKAQNETTVDVRSRQISLPQQAALDSKDSVATSERNLTLKARCDISCFVPATCPGRMACFHLSWQQLCPVPAGAAGPSGPLLRADAQVCADRAF